MFVPRVTRFQRDCASLCKLRRCSSRPMKPSDDEVPPRPERKLKEWRKWPEPEKTFFQMFSRPQPKGETFSLPFQIKTSNDTLWKKFNREFYKYDQRFVKERHKSLGCDLAAGHFLVSRGGKVKYHGRGDWITKTADGEYELPETFDSSWRLTHIDVSGHQLWYEGLENFKDLHKVIWANFSNNPLLDDWCVDYLCANLRNIEYLDISKCPKVTERSMEGLYRLSELKTLIITDWRQDFNFELTTMMLEDCMPNLRITVKGPEELTTTRPFMID